MKEKIFTAILIVTLIISAGMASAFSLPKEINDIKNEKNDTTLLIPLSEEDFDKIQEFIDNIKDEEKKKKVEELFDLIITDNGKIDISLVEQLTKKYTEEIGFKIGKPSDCPTCNNDENVFFPTGAPLGSSTVYEPPYTGCYSWGDGVVGGTDDYEHSCNRYSGAIGAYASAWIGGATAEGMQKLNFYVGRSKYISIEAEILRTGGASTFGLGAFAGTDKSWSWDDFQENYHKSEVDPWWNWDDIILKIISMVTMLSGLAVGTIKEAIEILGLIGNFAQLFNALVDLYNAGDAEYLYINFGFVASPGSHNIWVGLRANTGACITGTGVAVTAGQVTKITIDGIAPPNNPTVSGPSSAETDETCYFYLKSVDPNNDQVQFKIDWGDGNTADWGYYCPSGQSVQKSHTYGGEGTFTIKVRARDIDNMISLDYGTHTITIEDDPPCCFPAGTKITMADGTCKNIENIRVGDRIKSYNPATQKSGSWRVKMLGKPVHPVMTINEGLIQATVDHPFFVTKSDGTKGFAVYDTRNIKNAVTYDGEILQLEIGDQLLTSDGEKITVESITYDDSNCVQTYNLLSLSGTKTYFANGLLVYEEHPPQCITDYLLSRLGKIFPRLEQHIGLSMLFKMIYERLP